MRPLTLAVISLAVVVPSCSRLCLAQEDEPSAEVVAAAELKLDEAYELGEAGKHKEAYEKAREAAELLPDWADAQYTAGLSAFLSDQFDKAAVHFGKVKKLEPDDWAARAKLIQTYQALGQTEKRDAEREELFEKFKNTDDKEYREKNCYVREQFVWEDRRVFVFEHFELRPPYKTIYSVVVTKHGSETEEDFKICMETPDTTTEVARSVGEITQEQRIYSLDGYNVDGVFHATYALLIGEPSYEDFRANLMDILAGKMKAVSATYKKPSQNEDQEPADTEDDDQSE